jgi:pimeloyl-ACP methyl ester carboxylesterase
MPNATNRWLPGAGHMLGFEAPEAIIAAVTER